MQFSHRKISLLGLMTVLLCGTSALADVIDFEQFSGPSTFGGLEQTLNIPWSGGNVTISGGTVLTDATFLSADETSVYGTRSGFSNRYSSTITITFPQNINNFFLNIYNGETHPDTFTVADNAGRFATVTIASNLNGGTSLVSFPAIGNVITINTKDPRWDFFIDNIGFDQETPGTPEPSTLGLFSLAGVAFLSIRRLRALSKH